MLPAIDVELINVTKRFGRRILFEGLNETVRSGQCLAVTGKNGSGKSTLIKIIAGLVRPSTGKVTLLAEGREVAGCDRYGWLGLVSPEVVMYNALTGWENIRFLTEARGLVTSDAEISRCFHLVGLHQYRDDRTATYSTGMKQRLKLAVLLAVRPSLWLLDEPSANLDADGMALVSETVKIALNSGAAVIIATNDPGEAAYATQQIMLV